MIEYIINNYQWIFSGVGVTSLVLLGTFFLKRPKNDNVVNEIFGAAQPVYKPIFSIYSLIPNFILKWRFNEARLNSFIDIDVRSRGDVVRLNLGELPDCQIWIKLVNHSPFDLEIGSMKAELNYNGCRINVETKDHIDISKHSSNENILLEGTLTGEQAIHCSKESKNEYTSLTLRTRIKTKFGTFKKSSGDLQYLHIDIINKREIKRYERI